MTIDEKLAILPSSPGVYLMYDSAGQVIYVGKAVSLKNRVRQYFSGSAKLPKVKAMVDNISDLGYILTLSEKDALSLEANLVKKYNPRYNILLKDDKHSPYIRIDTREDFPTATVTRKVKKDGAKYFGPYFNGIRVGDMLDIIRSAYRMRTCFRMPKRVCLHYHIDMCLGPCAGSVTQTDYNIAVQKVIAFLSGKDDDAEILLTKRMEKAAEEERFERAIEYREKLKMLKLLKERNIASLTNAPDIDSIAFMSDGTYGAITVNIVRGGKMMGVKSFSVTDAALSSADSLSSFVTQYYATNELPPELLFNALPENPDALREYLYATRGSAVTLALPQKGMKKRLVEMAEKNAAEYLESSVERLKHTHDMTVGAAERLRRILGIKSTRRIECYDISNISGTDKVASGVVFIDGAPSKSDYRRYRIKTVEGADDFASLREVLHRRLTGDLPPPDLLLIDGGKGQLSAVLGVVRPLNPEIPVISLAEKQELVFVEGQKEPLTLAKSDYALRLLIRLRDEAHRFAITYHRTLRARRLDSELLQIEGVGRKKLEKINRAVTYKEIKALTADEIAQKTGIDIKTAQNIALFYKEKS